MCRGLAIVAWKDENNEWLVNAMKGVSSHDDLLSEMGNDFECGRHHLKFELTFPMVLRDDIRQDVAQDETMRARAYPDGWLVSREGRYTAVPEAFAAVAMYLAANPDLLVFTPEMMQRAEFDHVIIKDRTFDNSRFDNSRFDNSRFDRSTFDNSRFDNSRFDDSVSFRYCTMNKVSFINVDLSGVDFTGTDLSSAVLNKTIAGAIGVAKDIVDKWTKEDGADARCANQ